MAIETEIKYRLTSDQFERVKRTLVEIDAEYLGEDFEENIIYSGDLLKSLNAILRIRKIGEKTILTFKKRLPSESGIKEQIEHETNVEDASEMQQIIRELGCKKILVYEKKRKTWKFREVEIVLDELPFGLFMEIEGTILTIKEAEMFINADEFEVEHKTYPHLTNELGKVYDNCVESRF